MVMILIAGCRSDARKKLQRVLLGAQAVPTGPTSLGLFPPAPTSLGLFPPAPTSLGQQAMTCHICRTTECLSLFQPLKLSTLPRMMRWLMKSSAPTAAHRSNATKGISTLHIRNHVPLSPLLTAVDIEWPHTLAPIRGIDSGTAHQPNTTQSISALHAHNQICPAANVNTETTIVAPVRQFLIFGA